MCKSWLEKTVHRKPFTFQGEDFLLEGKPFRIFSGEVHYFRIPQEYWHHRIRCAKAMGLNTISTYMPWNLHEPSPGAFNFEGMADVERFIQLAQEEDLKVILRPGPYICAEWEFGGLPSWLLRIPDIKVRCLDERYMEAVERYFRKVGSICAKYQYHQGGPIILVQVENEYGAFGNDREYMDRMLKLVREVGFDGQLYTCDWATPANMRAGSVEGAVAVANFGSRAADQLAILKKLKPHQPIMCGEFWAGWFDAWGTERNGSADSEPVVKELRWMLENNASFNFYMFHGGTSFGFMAGSNHYETYEPTVSSYDYWAPLDECGRPTQKYFALRSLLSGYQENKRALPEPPPPPLPIISIPRFSLQQSAGLFENLPTAIRVAQPKSMEKMGQDFGVILYRTDIAGLGDQELKITEVHDFATLRVNDITVGSMDRRLGTRSVNLKNIPNDRAILDILIDTMGRTNFGPKILDFKGITDRVEYGELTLMGWDIFPIAFDEKYIASLRWTEAKQEGPAFYRGHFNIDIIGDTFLDMRAWKRGVVWVNSYCLSRFWRIGPQQTVYLPGVWLKKGKNEIIVFDIEPSKTSEVEGLMEPIFNELAESENSKTEDRKGQ